MHPPTCEVRRRKFEKSNKTWGLRGLFPNLFALISMGVVNAAVVMKTEKQSIVPKSFIVMMMVMLGIALLPIRYYGYYVLLKIVICGGCAFLAAIAYGDGRKYLV